MTSPDISLVALSLDTDFIKQAKGMGLETLGDIAKEKRLQLYLVCGAAGDIGKPGAS